jgi:hypothetical protein
MAASDLEAAMDVRERDARLWQWLMRAATVGVLSVLAGLGAGRASADPPAPTDYRSEVVSITPPIDGVEVRVVGGDSFLELVASPGLEVIVFGYDDEPYLRVLADGGIEENQRSPARWLNQNRYATTPVPAEADASAPPVWKRIASGHRWAWHDHRTHWMSSVPPSGHHAGHHVVDSVVPLQVDGRAVEVAVVSTLVADSSRLPWLLAAGGALVVTSFVVRRTGRAALAAVASIAAGAALVIGSWQTLSLPTAVGPPLTAWALPATALIAAIAAFGTALFGRWSSFTQLGLTVVAAGQLLVWLVVRRAVFLHPVLPTSAPFWLDRATTAAVGISAAVVALVALRRAMHSDGFRGSQGSDQVGTGAGDA